ncbi:MAG: hypothetical protein M0Z48_01585 [Nitrospiraceae bacterium]|nr:hypothetical protein [Nitrospiraceae bacterium]
MKTELESQDIEAIALRVAEIFKPMPARSSRPADDTIFDVQGLVFHDNKQRIENPARALKLRIFKDN